MFLNEISKQLLGDNSLLVGQRRIILLQASTMPFVT
jgi:hypothetical protein